jgi:hypothetical protein
VPGVVGKSSDAEKRKLGSADVPPAPFGILPNEYIERRMRKVEGKGEKRSNAEKLTKAKR